MDTFIPWEALCSEEENNTKEAKTADNDLIKITLQEKANKIEQYIDSTLLYEKIREDKIIKSETELMKVCWYYKYEFKLFLEQAEFHSITLHPTTFSMNPNGILYAAIA